MSNIQITHDVNPNNARSESSIAIKPSDPQKIVVGSKKFKNIATYDFTLATAYSLDGGKVWNDSAELDITGWDGISDPALTWGDSDNVFLVALPFNNPPTIDVVGIAIYKSIDGGKTWSKPNLIHTSADDDKQWAAADNGSSKYHGRVYAVWDDGSNMRFARTLDQGINWIGTGDDPAGSIIATGSFAPEINVAPDDGAIYIVWRAAKAVKMIVSTDGGNSFQPAASPATGITRTDSSLPSPHGWPVFPGANFRVVTLPTACAALGQTVAVAWDDYREGVSRIYYALSTNGGAKWDTPPSGQPLLTGALPANKHHFQPQIVSDPYGVIGCAFYEYGLQGIDVVMAQSDDGGATFSQRLTVTDQPWNPAIDAPLSHGGPDVTFIGDYFGLDASTLGFYPLWTDTRTGIQELWTDVVPRSVQMPNLGNAAILTWIMLIGGITIDGGGWAFPAGGGPPVPVDPWGPLAARGWQNLSPPKRDILMGLVISEIASLINDPETRRKVEQLGKNTIQTAAGKLSH